MDQEPSEQTPNTAFLSDRMRSVLRGEQGDSQSGNWRISNLNSPTIVDMFYQGGKAIYAFGVDEGETDVQVLNYHREAETGNGTPSLKELHEAFASMARESGKDIQLIFPDFGQKDTAEWLNKNGYGREEDDDGEVYFVKEFKH